MSESKAIRVLVAPAPREASPWLQALRATWDVACRDRFAMAGLAIYAVFILIALTAPLLAPYPPLELTYAPDGNVVANVGPSREHLLGTTNLGRDIFSQLVYGSRPAPQ